LTSGKPNASLLEQFRISKLATRGKLSTDHPYQPQVGSDEALPSQRSVLFEKSQLLVRRVCETGTRRSRITCQQASLYRALQLDNFARCQQRFLGRILGDLGHADTLKQRVPLATPSNPKSVDNWSLREREASVFSANAAGMQSFCDPPPAPLTSHRSPSP
jgi:hypothetical protein